MRLDPTPLDSPEPEEEDEEAPESLASTAPEDEPAASEADEVIPPIQKWQRSGDAPKDDHDNLRRFDRFVRKYDAFMGPFVKRACRELTYCYQEALSKHIKRKNNVRDWRVQMEE